MSAALDFVGRDMPFLLYSCRANSQCGHFEILRAPAASLPRMPAPVQGSLPQWSMLPFVSGGMDANSSATPPCPVLDSLLRLGFSVAVARRVAKVHPSNLDAALDYIYPAGPPALVDLCSQAAASSVDTPAPTSPMLVSRDAFEVCFPPAPEACVDLCSQPTSAGPGNNLHNDGILPNGVATDSVLQPVTHAENGLRHDMPSPMSVSVESPCHATSEVCRDRSPLSAVSSVQSLPHSSGNAESARCVDDCDMPTPSRMSVSPTLSFQVFDNDLAGSAPHMPLVLSSDSDVEGPDPLLQLAADFRFLRNADDSSCSPTQEDSNSFSPHATPPAIDASIHRATHDSSDSSAASVSTPQANHPAPLPLFGCTCVGQFGVCVCGWLRMVEKRARLPSIHGGMLGTPTLDCSNDQMLATLLSFGVPPYACSPSCSPLPG